MKKLNQFVGTYPVHKTLRFELRPVGKTEEWIKEGKIIEEGKQKALDYPIVKKLIDEYHKVCISKALSREALGDKPIDWTPLRDALNNYRRTKSDEDKKVLEKEQKTARELVGKALTAFEHYGELTAATPKKLIKNVLPEFQYDEALQSFNRFATYFEGFQENRKNIYSTEDISTGVPFRIVHDNFPKFLIDIEVYETIKKDCPEVIEQAAKELQPYLEGVMLDDIFSLDYYNSLLTQEGIGFFNRVIGGVSEEGNKKYRGINELSNQYRQDHSDVVKKKAVTMIPLFKQILSDRETLSFIPQEIENDDMLIKAIEDFNAHIFNFERDGEQINIVAKLVELIKRLVTFEDNGIYIAEKHITDISQKVYGSWGVIKERLHDYLSKDAYSLHEMQIKVEELVSSYFKDIDKSICVLDGYWKQVQEWKKQTNVRFQNSQEGIECVKRYFDALMDVLHHFAIFNVSGNYDVDINFYNDYTPLYAELESIIPLYNKVRNYLTKKPSDIKKFKLTFEAPTLANGWDQNKERDNKAVLLFKDNLSYLGVMNANNTPDFNEQRKPQGECYSKMIYKLLPGPNKMLPKVFFSKKGRETFSPSSHILQLYNDGTFKKGSSFNLVHLHELINFYKDAISRHPDWSKFDFKFPPTESYEDISAFYNDISEQAYKVRFTEIPVEQVDEWVNNGQLYLFQLYNKDYAEGAHGKKNLHTLYWENLFTDANMKDLVLKLNGEAELFYRPQSITTPAVHKVGSKMLNRRDKSGMPIPESIYRDLYLYYNGNKAEQDLTDADKMYLDKVVVKDVKHEITKDRRFTKSEFFFHVPITFNANAGRNDLSNDDVKIYLKDNPDVNIIGIDRGERHLIYLTLINQRGEILKQKTFNTVNKFNYHEKLTQRENERDEARKSWSSIGKIKDLKEGFLSAVIHEIATMMVENNAIVVLEDLNFGFKRGRFKVERQVYQKFEKMLIDKLNYLCFKDCQPNEAGGILRGYQLTQKFVSFTKMGKQSGFLFYIPAAYTSKIDPVTGFVNHFNFHDITNTKKRKNFFMEMESIRMRNGHIEFEFDYRKFTTYQTDYQNRWIVSTRGKRIILNENGYKQMRDYYPTEEIKKAFKEAFKKMNVTLDEGTDVKSLMEKTDDSSFYSTLFSAFKYTLQMRNSNAQTEEDYILSPVAKDGRYFCSTEEANKGVDANGHWISKLPVDADANGAYHIALKGLYLLDNPDAKKIEHAAWLRYMAEKPYLDS